MKRAALYLRVSTRDKGQDADNQRRELCQFCKAQGWQITQEYEEPHRHRGFERPARRLEAENEGLQEQLDEISEILSPEEDDEEEAEDLGE